MKQQLGGMDASFLYMETPETPMHVAGLSIVELPAGFHGSFYDTYKAHIASRLHLLPVLQKKIVHVPWDIDHPLWVDDDEIDSTTTSVTSAAQARDDEAARGARRPPPLQLPRPQPAALGVLRHRRLADDTLAIYTKIHHAAVDGGAGMVLTNMMYDTTPCRARSSRRRRTARRSRAPDALACSAPPTRTCSASMSARCRRSPTC
jgi:hypothetical protein